MEYGRIKGYIETGNGKKWLDNAMIRIYREHFTLPEVEAAIAFYKTSAGQKMASDFPILMIQSLKAAELIMEYAKEKR